MEEEHDPILFHTNVEEDTNLSMQPMPPPSPPQRPAVGVGDRVGRRQPTLYSTSNRVVEVFVSSTPSAYRLVAIGPPIP